MESAPAIVLFHTLHPDQCRRSRAPPPNKYRGVIIDEVLEHHRHSPKEMEPVDPKRRADGHHAARREFASPDQGEPSSRSRVLRFVLSSCCPSSLHEVASPPLGPDRRIKSCEKLF